MIKAEWKKRINEGGEGYNPYKYYTIVKDDKKWLGYSLGEAKMIAEGVGANKIMSYSAEYSKDEVTGKWIKEFR